MNKKFIIPYDVTFNFKDMPFIYIIAIAFNISNKFKIHDNNLLKNKIVNYFNSGITIDENISIGCLDNIDEYEEIVEWFKLNLAMKAIESKLSSFENSLKDLFVKYSIDKNAKIHYNDLGLISCIPKVYKEAKEREYYDEVIDDIRSKSEYVGSIKERNNFKLKLISKRYVRDRAFWIINGLHDERNLITYFDSKDDVKNVNVGDMFKIRSTIKRHEFSKFNRCKETQLTRVVYQ